MPLYAHDDKVQGWASKRRTSSCRLMPKWQVSHFVFIENVLSGLLRCLADPRVLVPAAAPKPKAPPSRGTAKGTILRLL